MSTLTTINNGDLITDSRAVINNNFSALNTDKMETSVLDTDTALTANSDAKVATQKAVKAYVDAGGNVNASTTVKGIAEEADATETNAGTAVGGTGARLFVNPSNLAGYLSNAGYISKVASGSTTKDMSVTTSTTLAHGLGIAPKLTRITAGYAFNSNISSAETHYSAGAQTSYYIANEVGTLVDMGSEFRIYDDVSAGRSIAGVVTVDATNITITWTRANSPTGTARLAWSAIA